MSSRDETVLRTDGRPAGRSGESDRCTRGGEEHLSIILLTFWQVSVTYSLKIQPSTPLLKSLGSEFLASICNAHQSCFYVTSLYDVTDHMSRHLMELYFSKKNSFLFEYHLKFNLFLWCKAEFSASLLQSSVSHDPSEISLICWFAAQETFLIINSGENSA